MITFWSGHYTAEQLEALVIALNRAQNYIQEKAHCSIQDTCIDCKFKEPCKDLNRLQRHVTDLAG